MQYARLDQAVISKLTSLLAEDVTCLECCKYYIAPETASCGHTLCHTCWRGRHTCPDCGSTLNRKSLKFNSQIQIRTDHVNLLVDEFERLFDVKLQESILDLPAFNEKESENVKTKNVKDWLTNSENHFSVPPSNSQQSTQELHHLVGSSDKIQIHTDTKKTTSPSKIIRVLPSQDDWDKIEIMPDTEVCGIKNKENIIAPIDIETLHTDENEYTTEKPRRSSRRKELKNNSPVSKIHGTNKHSSNNSSTDETDIKQRNTKQTWNSVKKMRKEFSKLSKKNKNKLNVSIEMCKKTQSTLNKANIVALPVVFQPSVCDNNTPNILIETQTLIKSNTVLKNKADDILTLSSKSQQHNDNGIEKCAISNEVISNCISSTSLNCNDANKKYIQNERNIGDNVVNIKNDQLLSTKQSLNHNTQESFQVNKVPFYKKSSLRMNSTESNSSKHNDVNTNYVTTNSDDIEISIKVGTTVTNIFIKKKNNDVELKVNTDSKIQTSLDPHGLFTKNKTLPIDNTSQDKEINIEDGNKVFKITTQNIVNECHKTQPVKSTSTKKNTASADTATACFEITESVEKELSNTMECEKNCKSHTQSHVTEDNDKLVQIRTNENRTETRDLHNTAEDIEHLDDLDMFNTGSVKICDTNVQLLKHTAHTSSEILMSTIKSHKTKTQKIDKRVRDTNEEVMPQKRIKIDTKKDKVKDTEIPLNTIQTHDDSENYDVIMDKVFANIDADMQDSVKTQDSIKSTHDTIQNQTNSEIYTCTENSQQIQTQTKQKNTTLTPTGKDTVKDKYSENVFSLIEKDNVHDVITTETAKNPGPETQQHIENLLTPVMCQNLALTTEGDTQTNDLEMNDMCTPLQDNDDSDKSIVEETPQKNISFSKLKSKNENNTIKNSKAELQKSCIGEDNKETNLKNQLILSQDQKTVISLLDSLSEGNKEEDINAVEIDKQRQTLETPMTINKFVDQIKHKSTPMARKSLNFAEDNNNKDPDQTLCLTSSEVAKTTQEKDFLHKAFEQTPERPVGMPLTTKIDTRNKIKTFCVGGSCLSTIELRNVKLLCIKYNWAWLDKYSKDLTHLVVGVDEENKSQRSVKYMCALAAGKWILSYAWVEKCLQTNIIVDEEPYEALDSTGDPGPRLSRISKHKLFQGITFYCMPPFSVLDVDTLRGMLVDAGGRIVDEPQSVRVTDESPALLLAEPENTQEDRFIFLAMKMSIVPVNYEWVLNCLGSYTLSSIHEQLLCPALLLPAATWKWPNSLLAPESE